MMKLKKLGPKLYDAESVRGSFETYMYADQCFFTWWKTSINNGTLVFTVFFNFPSNLIQIPLGKCHNTISWHDLFKTSTFKNTPVIDNNLAHIKYSYLILRNVKILLTNGFWYR